MADSELNIPRHIGRLRIVSADRVALVMAGVNSEVESVQDAEYWNYNFWNEAKVYKEAILQAIKLKEITPISVSALAPEHWGSAKDAEIALELDEIDINTFIVNANFLASDIWPWAQEELSENTFNTNNQKQESITPPPTINQESKEITALKNQVEELGREIEELNKRLPCHIGSFIGSTEKDPLYQAIRIRNTEWANYDPSNDRLTRGNQAAITKELIDAGFSGPVSKAIEAVACPINRNPAKVA